VQKPRHIGDLLKGGAPRLQNLQQRAKAALALRDVVQGALPSALAAHVVSAAQRQQDVVVAVDSAAFCARLRFEAPRVKAAVIQATGDAVNRIIVRVQLKGVS
jgi:hypothetical protein